MADQRRWFKVWTTILHDPTFLSLPLEALGRWVLLGAWIAAHGTKGSLYSKESAFRHVLRIPEDVTVQCALMMLPNVQFGEAENRNGARTVTLSNWLKYQEDTTMAERQRRHRYKRRGEEKRGEEKRKETPPSSPPSGGTYPARFEAFWADYPKKAGKGAAVRSWLRLRPTQDLADRILAALAAQKQSEQWLKDNGQFIPHPATWLNQRRWEDEVPAADRAVKSGTPTSVDPKSLWNDQKEYLIARRAGRVRPSERVPEWEN